jgi:hypothetical protein
MIENIDLEKKKKIYRTRRAFVRDARYSFLNKINFRPLVDQDPDNQKEYKKKLRSISKNKYIQK